MSVRLMSMVFENQELSSTEKLIMLALADHANDEGKSIYPSQITVSRKTGLARGTVNRHVQSLIDNDFLWDKGYRIDKSNVLELEINVKRLAENVGVTESDTQVSRRVTGGVTEDDTNHQLTIIKNHQLKKGNPNLFEACKEIYETKKKLPITDGSSFSLMINNFKKNGVIPEDYAAAIDAMSKDPRYKRATNPTSYEKYTLGIADKRQNPVVANKRNTSTQSATDLILQMVERGEI